MAKYLSFNPCSRGCFARSELSVCADPPLQGFQSLFSWMFRSKSRGTRRSFRHYPVSILVLVDVSLEVTIRIPADVRELVSILVLVDVSLEATKSAGTMTFARCFNPCSRGCFARSQIQEEKEQKRMAFQSLFSWMFRSKNCSAIPTPTSTRFNPCSRGCFARRSLFLLSRRSNIRFQSLFSWMFRSKVPQWYYS